MASPLSQRGIKEKTSPLLPFAALALTIIAALGIFVHLSTPWNGYTIRVTNQCDFDIYVDDGYDGLQIDTNETISWDRAAKTGRKEIRVWRLHGIRSGDEGMLVQLIGDSVVAGADCPSLTLNGLGSG